MHYFVFILSQRDLAESGMPSHEIANAMSIAMSMAVDVDGCKEVEASKVQQRFEEELKKGMTLSKEDIEAILALTGIKLSVTHPIESVTNYTSHRTETKW